MFHFIQSEFKSSSFYYVSAAFRKLMYERHSITIEQAMLPAGELILRENQKKVEFKLSAIRKILKQNTAQYVLMLGDNAEYDPLVYEQIKTEFPDRKILIYIRKAYENAVQITNGQKSFLSPMEIIRDLHEKGIISFEKTKWIMSRILLLSQRDINKTGGRTFFPSFTRHGDFDVNRYFEYYRTYTQIQSKCAAYFY